MNAPTTPAEASQPPVKKKPVVNAWAAAAAADAEAAIKDMFGFEGSAPALVAEEPPKAPRAKSDKKVAALAVDPNPRNNFDLFSDDPMAAIAIIELAEAAQQDVDAAIAANPSILSAVAQTPEQEIAAREGLDFARFMRTAGLPAEQVAEALTSSGKDAPALLEKLAQVEAEVGADYPEEVVPELADEYGAEDDLTAEVEAEAAAIGGDADADSDEESPKKKRKKAGEEVAADSALVALLRRIRGKRYEPLTIDQENALAARIRDGDLSARNELVDHNMRFLVLMAKRFTYTGRPMDVLISAGTTGLITAAQKFDPTRGRFTTCASQWIRQSIQRSLLTDSLLKTPAYLPAKASKLRKAADAATDADEKARLTAEADNVDREVKARRATHVSLDGGQDDDSDGGGLHNMFAAESEGPDELMEKRQLVSQLVKAAMELTDADGEPNERGRDIFLLRIGLHEDHIGEPQTLAQVADIYDISRERVRQIYTVAAIDVANAVQVWARGADNLPPGFRKSLLNPGR
jgi:RNA polymerase primary sigma factor